MMRIPTSDLPILLSDTVYAEVCKACAEKEDRKRKKAGSTTIRIRTLDLKTSPSALPAGQRKKKFVSSEEIDVWVNSCEDSNLRLCNIGIKCSTS